MKTLFWTQPGDNNTTRAIGRMINVSGKLPDDVLNSKMFDSIYQWGLIGHLDGTGEHFYINSEMEKMAVDAIPGTIEMRVDYEPALTEEMSRESGKPHSECVFDEAIMALSHPNSHDHYPEDTMINCIRISIKLGVESVMTKSFWPVGMKIWKD